MSPLPFAELEKQRAVERVVRRAEELFCALRGSPGHSAEFPALGGLPERVTRVPYVTYAYMGGTPAQRADAMIGALERVAERARRLTPEKCWLLWRFPDCVRDDRHAMRTRIAVLLPRSHAPVVTPDAVPEGTRPGLVTELERAEPC